LRLIIGFPEKLCPANIKAGSISAGFIRRDI